jgi:hypothetical protein
MTNVQLGRASIVACVLGAIHCGPTSAADSESLAESGYVRPPRRKLSKHGGAAMTTSHVKTVVWEGNEAIGQRVAAFFDWMLRSEYWTDALSQYGVGTGAATGVVVLPGEPDAAFFDDATPVIQAMVDEGIIARPTETTVLAFLIPSRIHLPGDVYGYHSETTTPLAGTKKLPYLVAPLTRRADKSFDFDELTRVLSHEAAELATDPHPPEGWYADDTWFGEVGDLCDLLTQELAAPSQRYRVQRLYSNESASEYTSDPCVPSPVKLAYGVAPLHDVVRLALDTRGNGRAELDLQAFSFRPRPPLVWNLLWTNVPAGVAVDVEGGTLKAGERVRLTFTASGAAPDASGIGNAFVIGVLDPSHPQTWASQWNAELRLVDAP